MTRIAICCGVGGAGKTTTSAALAVGHAQAGLRTVVLTIDPARRLADALGVAALSNAPQRVPLPDATGELHALMLDRQQTWDGVIRRFSADDSTAERILSNPYYRAVSTRLTGSHEYMAIEKLHELASSGEWDVVVVDTPPTRHVLDFFEAPDRVRRIFDRSVLSVLVQPTTGLFGAARQRLGRTFLKLAGDRVLSDISEFFGLVGGLADGFRTRHAEAAALLRAPTTTYWLVAHADAPWRNDLQGFLNTLEQRGMRFGGFLLNRCRPDLPERPAEWPDLGVADPVPWTTAVDNAWQQGRAQHECHRQAAADLSEGASGAPVWMVPDRPVAVGPPLDFLAHLAAHLPPNAPVLGDGDTP